LHGPDLIAGGPSLLKVLAGKYQAAPDSGGTRGSRGNWCHLLTSLDAGNKDRLASLALGQHPQRYMK
jgi:hypothetical protein